MFSIEIIFQVPFERRLQEFKEMLKEKNVSTGSTWEKELSKIVFDKRYLLLNAIERKAVRYFLLF